MKRMKKLVGILLSMVMIIGMSFGAFADGETTYSITIKGVEAANHTYEAYQIFSGDFSGDVLVNVAWGEGIDSEKLSDLYTDLAKISGFDSVSETDGVESVIEAVENLDSNSDALNAFANVVAQYLGTKATATISTTQSNDLYNYKISGLSAGYYLIKDKDNSSIASYTDYIVKVANNTEINVKSATPELDKVISEDSQDVNSTTYVNGTETDQVAMGDTITYKLTSNVPSNMSAYNKYYFVVHDTMDKGLTFDPTSVTVTIGEGSSEISLERKATNGVAETYSGTKTYELNYETDDTTGETTIEIVFNNFIQYAELDTEVITITYNAMLNENAVVGTKGNDNVVYLEYSNNPNYTYDSDDDKPGPGEPKGETPEDKTTTYVTGIKIIKVDDEEKPLTGAEFTITGEDLVNIVVVTKEQYSADDDGTWYQLKDGTYTETVPTEETKDYYVDTSVTYKKETVTETKTKDANYSVSSYVDDNGYLILTGLCQGTYTITETVTPTGYNTIEPVNVSIVWTKPTSAGLDCGWKATSTGSKTLTMNEDGVFEITIMNEKGTLLPSTGGMGTTIFYIIGSVMVIGAAVLLITKRRMGNMK